MTIQNNQVPAVAVQPGNQSSGDLSAATEPPAASTPAAPIAAFSVRDVIFDGFGEAMHRSGRVLIDEGAFFEWIARQGERDERT